LIPYRFEQVLNSATSGYKTHKVVKTLLPKVGVSLDRYFRLEPQTGDVELDESRPAEIERMRGTTRQYLQEKEEKLARLGELLGALRV
jgi:hypothetical protein